MVVIAARRPAGFCYWRRTLIVSTDETVRVPAAGAAGARCTLGGRCVVCRTSHNVYDAFCRSDSSTEPLIGGALP